MGKLVKKILPLLIVVAVGSLWTLSVLASPGAIDIGAEAINRGTTTSEAFTYIDRTNPANASGTITTVEIWANTPLVGCIVGTFYKTNGSTLKCRDSVAIGSVASGSKQTFSELSIAVEVGDYIGFYATSGRVERDSSGFGGNYRLVGEYIDPGDEATYSLVDDDGFSLYGIGAEAGADPPTVTTQAATSIEATTATGNGNITAVNNGTCDLRGFVWDLATQGAPGNVAPGASGYANDVPESDGFGTGAFTGNLTGLPTGDTIYARAYAHTVNGYGYGDEINFLTKPAAPTNVSATDGAHTDRVVVTWTKSTGATSYRVYEGVNLLDTLGDIATFDDNTAPAGTITQGNTVASDGTDTAHIDLSLAGTSANNGAIRTYKVGAFNATGDSDDSATDTGYRGVGVLTYQWQRSAGDGDAGYGNIGGAVGATYDDDGAPVGVVTPGTASASDGASATHITLSVAGESVADGEGRWYQCVLSAPDAIGQTSVSNRGYRTTGAITYQWQRSATDSNANYAPLGGATTNPYNDTTVPEDEGRWYYCEISATGVVTQDTTPDRGYLGDSGITTDEAEPLSVGGIILRTVPIVIAGVVCIFVIRRNMDIRNLLFGALVGLLAFIIVDAIIKAFLD